VVVVVGGGGDSEESGVHSRIKGVASGWRMLLFTTAR